jgi:nicotinamide riboside kinase
VYAELYYPNTEFPELEKYAKSRAGDLYFLTYIDIPWEADSIRDLPNERDVHFKAFESKLITYNLPFVLLKGNENLRFEKAKEHLEKLIRE